ncbi:ESPR-type extended signal peptide-containing protein [Pasteurellaceae bacterium 22721_9_1]
MNNIFKVIWNHATQTWVAVSELQSAKGKTKSSTKAVIAAVASLVVVDALAVTGGTVGTATTSLTAKPIEYDSNTNKVYSGNAAKGPLQVGGDVSAIERPNEVYISTPVSTDQNLSPSERTAILIGKGASFKSNIENSALASYGAIIIGTNATVESSSATARKDSSKVGGYSIMNVGPSIAIGSEAKTIVPTAADVVSYKTPGNEQFYSDKISKRTLDPALNSKIDTAVTNVQIDSNGYLSQAVKTSASSVPIYNGLGGNVQHHGYGTAIALGNEARAKSSAVAIGSVATADLGVAVGAFTTARGSGTAVGMAAAAVGANSMALGRQAAGAGDYAQAIGAASSATGKGSIALGVISTAKGKGSIAIGNGLGDVADTNEGFDKIISRQTATLAGGENAIVIGTQALSKSSNANSTVVIGNKAIAGDNSETKAADNAIAVGNTTVAKEANSIAMGNQARAEAVSSTAIGDNAVVTHKDAVSLGSNSVSAAGTSENSATVNGVTYQGFAGKDGVATNSGLTVSVGDVGKERQIKNVAAGKISATSTDAINGSQLYLALNKAGWNLDIGKTIGTNDSDVTADNGVEHIAPGETVKFIAGKNIDISQKNGEITITANITPATPTSVNVDGTTIKKDGDVIKANTSPITVTSTTQDGNKPTFTTTNPDSLAKAGDVQNVAEKLVAEGLDFTGNNNGVTVHRDLGTKLTIKGGNNGADVSDKNVYVQADAANNALVVKIAEKPQFKGINLNDGTNATNPNGVNITSSAPNTVNFAGDNNTPVTLTNLKDNLPKTDNTTPNQAAPTTLTEGDKKNAATVNDVLNAGWNLKGDNKNVDFVKPYDTVNFIDGIATDVTVTKNAKTGENDIKVDVKVDGTTIKVEGDKLTANTSPITVTSTAQDDTAPTFTTDNPDSLAKAGDVQKVAEKLVAEGLDFTGNNNGVTVHRDLGTKLTIKGGNNGADVSDKNVYVEADAANNALVVKIAEKPQFKGINLNDGTDPQNNPNGVNITSSAPNTVNFAGDNNAPVTLTNIKDNLTPTDDATKKQAAPTNLTEGDKKNAATVNDVLNAGFNLQNNGKEKDFVKAYDTLNFVDGTNSKVVIENTDGKVSTIKVNVDVDSLKGDLTGNVSVNEDEGTTSTTNQPADNKYATTNQVVEAINKSGWKATIGRDDNDFTDEAGKKVEVINPGDKVTYQAGKNLKIKQDVDSATKEVKFTYATKDDVQFKSVNINGDNNPNGVNMTSTAPNTLNLGGDVTDGKASPVTITGVAGNLPNTYNTDAINNTNQPVTKSQNLPVGVENKVNNAATVGDILNVGWNLKENNNVRDFVKAYDTVNFVNGTSTIANVTTADDGKSSNVTFHIDKGDINVNEATGAVSGPVTSEEAKKLGDAITNAENALKAAPDNLDLKNALEDAKKAADEAGLNKVATVQNVADAISKSGWQATIGRDDNDFTDEAGKKVEVINPGDKVTYQAGKNLKIKQDVDPATKEVKFTYATKDDVTFTNVNTNTLTVGGPKADPAKPDQPGTPAANINVVEGPATLDGTKPDDKLVRIQYQPVDKNGNPVGNPEQLATLNDGLKFEGNKGDIIKKKLNDTVAVKGSLANDADASAKNVRVDSKDGELIVKIAEKPEFKGVNLNDGKDPNNQNGVNITSSAPNTLNLGGDVKDGNISPVTITGVASNLPDTYNQNALNPDNKKPVTKSQDLPTGVEDKVNNAATVGDVLNTGWNLKNNGDAKDFVKPYDTVNFINGQSTIAKVTTKPDGLSSDVTFDVDLVDLEMEKQPVDPTKPNGPQQETGKVVVPVDQNGKPSKAIATASDVANAINNAGWKATIGRDDTDFNDQTGKATKLIKAGETVTYKSGKNLRVKQDGNNITYALSNDVDLGPNGSLKAGPVTINNKGINAGGTRITNVAPGKAPTDAVNVSQLKGVDKGLRAGIASAMAGANLYHATLPGKSMVAAGVGTYKGQSGFAVGYSRLSDNGKIGVKVMLNSNTQGDVGAAATVGYQW